MAAFDDLIAAWPVWPTILGAHMLLIAVPAGVAFFALYVWKGNPLRGRKIQPGFAPSHAIRREVFYSLLTAFIFALNGVFIYFSMANGWPLIYTDFADYGWLYGVFSLALTIVLHDAYFYWTHRLMHHPLLFERFHRLHHESHSPSPWAAYAFAPLEAVIQALFLTILIFVLPLHVTVIYLFMIHMIVRNVVGHSGFELFPRGYAGACGARCPDHEHASRPTPQLQGVELRPLLYLVGSPGRHGASGLPRGLRSCDAEAGEAGCLAAERAGQGREEMTAGCGGVRCRAVPGQRTGLTRCEGGLRVRPLR